MRKLHRKVERLNPGFRAVDDEALASIAGGCIWDIRKML